ncbi:MAG: polyphosphate polymerase domain-containing protein [Ignavibacteriaceae bacterium]|nr:polyphosphate polymerase domain-containing protein [Ignavibacteriaceae bacterium]
MHRSEYKYFIPVSRLDELRREILPYVSYDPHLARAKRTEYTVRSIYYDSPGLMTYHEKLAGLRERRKYRIRAYNDSSPEAVVFTEIKRKDGDHIWKDRASLLTGNIQEFLRTGSIELLLSKNGDRRAAEIYAGNFLYFMKTHRLSPVILITYEREAFQCPYGTELRITLDKNIRADICHSEEELFNEDFNGLVVKDNFVLEVKFREMIPGWLPRVIQKYNTQRTSASKYVMGMESVYENIRNKRIFV